MKRYFVLLLAFIPDPRRDEWATKAGGRIRERAMRAATLDTLTAQ